ncbi:MAG: flippase-like domain-containing protein [Chloroflexota bacterium]|nr:flippase-like domain-containing protein [Chloroflexota bacterium]
MVVVAFIVGIVGIVFSSYQWRSLLRGERIHFDLAELVNLYLVGIAFNHFLPTGMGGDAIKAFYVGRDSGNHAGSASAVVTCRIAGFFSMLIVALPVLAIWHKHITTGLILWFALFSLLIASMIGGAILSVTLLPRMLRGRWAKSRLVQHSIFSRVIEIGNALIATTRRPRIMGIAVAYGVLFWIVCILNCYTYAHALGIHTSLDFYFVAVPLISLISFLPISINGFGLRESAFVYIFAMVYVSSATALLLALFLDAQTLLFGAIGGCIWLYLSHYRK